MGSLVYLALVQNREARNKKGVTSCVQPLTQWSIVLLEKLIATQLVSPVIYGAAGLLPCPQESATCSYPKPDGSSHLVIFYLLRVMGLPNVLYPFKFSN